MVMFDDTHRCDVDYIEAYLKSRLMAFCQFIRNEALYLFLQHDIYFSITLTMKKYNTFTIPY